MEVPSKREAQNNVPKRTHQFTMSARCVSDREQPTGPHFPIFSVCRSPALSVHHMSVCQTIRHSEMSLENDAQRSFVLASFGFYYEGKAYISLHHLTTTLWRTVTGISQPISPNHPQGEHHTHTLSVKLRALQKHPLVIVLPNTHRCDWRHDNRVIIILYPLQESSAVGQRAIAARQFLPSFLH